MSIRGEETREQILSSTQALVLERGFAGTAIDDILQATGLSKGAFFYHFKNKADLGHALVVRYAEHDLSIFRQLEKRAEELSDDPLQSTLIFLKLFEEFIADLEDNHPGCLFASYVYEQENFASNTFEYVTQGFKEWKNIYQTHFESIMKKYQATIKVQASELAELIICIIQGAFILAKSLDDKEIIIRSSKHFRQYLQLIFKL